MKIVMIQRKERQRGKRRSHDGIKYIDCITVNKIRAALTF